MIGPLTTSFLQGKVNPTMTSTTCNQCAEHVTVESKTVCSPESHGAIHASSDPGSLDEDGWGMCMVGSPSTFKVKGRRRKQSWWARVRADAYWLRMLWHSHGKYWLKSKLKIKKVLEK